ncbi:MAG: hypothetical protein HY508_01425 [Acidobacteria bacterium]|nr:hypothetical protein [Acidobacteriota bacterium]
MQKGENAISVGVAGVMVLVFIAAQQRWQISGLEKLAASAEERILSPTGLHGETPDLSGYEKLKTFALASYQASLYRQTPAPLTFALGRFVVYDRANRPAFMMNTLEGSRETWTAVYDFAGRNGRSASGRRAKPRFTLDLTGNGTLEALIGSYSGGDRCCTIVTVLELGKETVRVLGRIRGLDGLPFEGLELRKVDQDPAWEILAHSRYRTLCGGHEDSADVISVYDYVNGEWSNQTPRHTDFLRSVLRDHVQKWGRAKDQSVQLLQTIAAEFAVLGERDQGQRFFAMNLAAVLPQLHKDGVDLNGCLEDNASLLARLPSVVQ